MELNQVIDAFEMKRVNIDILNNLSLGDPGGAMTVIRGCGLYTVTRIADSSEKIRRMSPFYYNSDGESVPAFVIDAYSSDGGASYPGAVVRSGVNGCSIFVRSDLYDTGDVKRIIAAVRSAFNIYMGMVIK